MTTKNALLEAMKAVTNEIDTITYTVYDSDLIMMLFNFTGPKAKQEAKACAANWWRAVNDELKGKVFYFSVGCTWVDEYGTELYEEVNTYNFPHKASLKPHQRTFEEPQKGHNRVN